MKNFLYRPFKWGLQWDGDWRPEGAGFIWDNGTFFADALGSWLESDTKKDQEFAWVAQAGAKFKLGDSAKLTIGAAYTNIDTAGGSTDARGSVIKGTYAIEKNWTAQFRYFINKIDENLGTEKDFDRLQLDLKFKY